MQGHRNLAGGTRHPAIGHQCHSMAPVLQHTKCRSEFMQLRHTIRPWALKTQYRNKILVQLAPFERFNQVFLGVKHLGGGLYHQMLILTAEVFIMARPKLPVTNLMPPSGLKGRLTGRNTSSSALCSGPWRHSSLPCSLT